MQDSTLHYLEIYRYIPNGNQNASLMIIGEAPGFYEDKQGEPFAGQAGQLLTMMLQSINLEREEIYIANVLKCRPPDNRDPNEEEAALCTNYLDQQIALIQPKLLLALGPMAAHYLLHTNASLESLRNKIHTYGKQSLPLIVSYHPAYLLRNPIDKKKSWLDLKFVKGMLSHGSNHTACK